jgi:uncharacterized protein (DUF1810 family)
MTDPHNLQRFVEAQDPIYGDVLAELRAGRKQSHWMWFIFPQIQGLGRSPTAIKFAISSRTEGEAYARHPILGPRLDQCTTLVNAVEDRSAGKIFGYPDDLKFRSSMTLFSQVASHNPLFEQALQKFFAGKPDPQTLALLG